MGIDTAGNLYISDSDNNRIRKVSPAGIITTIAGNGDSASSGDGGPAINARLVPGALAVDTAGNLYIADIDRLVRKVSPAGIITTVAGFEAPTNFSGDGGPATAAGLGSVAGLAVDNSGDLYIADTFNGRVRMVSPDGIITTVAGSGGIYGNGSFGAIYGYSGDGGPAASAPLNPYGLAIDSAGNVYVADSPNEAVRLLQPLGPMSISAVQNAASGLTGPVAPGEMVVISGSGLGPAQLVSSVPGSDGLLGTQLAGTTVQINGTPVPVIYTWATQVAAVVPDSVSGDTAQFTVTYQDHASASFAVPVAPAAPGIFTQDSTGRGHAATINQNGLIDTAANPGDDVTLFVTGIGEATSTVSIQGYNLPVLPVSVAKGPVPGVMQIKVAIPFGQDCDTPVVVQVGNASSQPGVTIAIALCI